MNGPEEMERKLATAPELQGILAELIPREPIFHRPEIDPSRVDFKNMTE
jgi:hypothetical protein